MEEARLKQRLVGAVVLVALAVIFIPMLLNGGSEMEMPVFGSNVPERSEAIKNIKHINIKDIKNNHKPMVNPPVVPIAKGMPEPKVVTKEKATSIVDVIAALTEEEPPPVAKNNVWAVQVGSFAKRSNALSLKEKLRKKKMHAFVERIMKNNKPVYRVRVGPEITRKKAEVLMKKLKTEFKLSGLVVKHP